MAYTDIKVEQIGSVCRILHDRPSVRNAENINLLAELDRALQAAESDPATKVVIVGGTGPHFSAGHDSKEASAERRNLTVEQRYEHENLRYLGYCLRLRDLSKPTIAQVQGACIAGAFMLANMCDLIVASEDAYFADPVVQSVGACAVEVLVHPWVMNTRLAKEMLFTGEKFTAQRALAIGMVNRVVARDELEEQTLALAQKIARAPSFSLMLTKRSINRSEDMQGMRTALNAHFDSHQLSHFSESMKEIVRASAEEKVERGRQAMS